MTPTGVQELRVPAPSRRVRLRAGGTLVVLALATVSCAATPPEDDPVQIKLHDVDTRVAKIERVVANQSLLDLSNQVESLRGDLRALHNDVDELNHGLEAARKQQHDLYGDLDQRLKILEARGAGGAGAGQAASGGAGGPASDGNDKSSYQAAVDLLKDGQYEKAATAFQSFLATYPNSPLADNAQYWLGEAHYVNKQFPEAAAAFQRVVDNYPQSRKLPDALLKIGYCDYELKEFGAARDALTQVTTKFPDSPASHLARERLDRMAAEKH